MTSSSMNMQMQGDESIRRSCEMWVLCLQLHSDRQTAHNKKYWKHGQLAHEIKLTKLMHARNPPKERFWYSQN
jgi:hypothetical protein